MISNHAISLAMMLGLATAIMQVESGMDSEAVGDGGKAVGILQIHPIMVEDVNRILTGPKNPEGTSYSLEDRKNKEKSLEMFWVYTCHYCVHTGDYTAEGIARRWNGGPKGHEKEATVVYWEKVKQALVSPRREDVGQGHGEEDSG